MEKHSLANYAWLIICVLIIAMMIMLATSFGANITTRIQGVIENFNGAKDNIPVSPAVPETQDPNAGLYDSNDRLIVSYKDSGLKADIDYVSSFGSKPGASAKIFQKYSNAIKVILPSYITRIGEFAFENCTSIKSVVIQGGPGEIRASAFSGCTNLFDISIPSSVTSLKNGIFSGCDSLNRLNYDSTFNDWLDINFTPFWDGNIDYFTLYCTDGSIAIR